MNYIKGLKQVKRYIPLLLFCCPVVFASPFSVWTGIASTTDGDGMGEVIGLRVDAMALSPRLSLGTSLSFASIHRNGPLPLLFTPAETNYDPYQHSSLINNTFSLFGTFRNVDVSYPFWIDLGVSYSKSKRPDFGDVYTTSSGTAEQSSAATVQYLNVLGGYSEAGVKVWSGSSFDLSLFAHVKGIRSHGPEGYSLGASVTF